MKIMEDSNKDIAVSFLKLASRGKFVKLIQGSLVSHSNTTTHLLKEHARQNPNKFFEMKREIAEGEFVVTHSYVQQKPGELGAAVVHIFRFENGRIVELWDLGQPVPEKSPNQYGMF